MSQTARSERAMRRWISWVRPDCFPLAASRLARSEVDPGSIEYSAVTHPLPRPRIHGGTRSSTEAVHSTRVRPMDTRTEPGAKTVKSRSKVTGRSWSRVRPSTLRVRWSTAAVPVGSSVVSRPPPRPEQARRHHSNTRPVAAWWTGRPIASVGLGGQDAGRHRRPPVGEDEPSDPGRRRHGARLASAQVGESALVVPCVGGLAEHRADARPELGDGPVRDRCRPSRRTNPRGPRDHRPRRCARPAWAGRGRWPRSCR